MAFRHTFALLLILGVAFSPLVLGVRSLERLNKEIISSRQESTSTLSQQIESTSTNSASVSDGPPALPTPAKPTLFTNPPAPLDPFQKPSKDVDIHINRIIKEELAKIPNPLEPLNKRTPRLPPIPAKAVVPSPPNPGMPPPPATVAPPPETPEAPAEINTLTTQSFIAQVVAAIPDAPFIYDNPPTTFPARPMSPPHIHPPLPVVVKKADPPPVPAGFPEPPHLELKSYKDTIDELVTELMNARNAAVSGATASAGPLLSTLLPHTTLPLSDAIKLQAKQAEEVALEAKIEAAEKAVKQAEEHEKEIYTDPQAEQAAEKEELNEAATATATATPPPPKTVPLSMGLLKHMAGQQATERVESVRSIVSEHMVSSMDRDAASAAATLLVAGIQPNPSNSITDHVGEIADEAVQQVNAGYHPNTPNAPAPTLPQASDEAVTATLSAVATALGTDTSASQPKPSLIELEHMRAVYPYASLQPL